jgi:maleate cis-trans isomerase
MTSDHKPAAFFRTLLCFPANNTTMEPEMSALCPELTPFAIARVRLPPRMLAQEDIPAYTDSTLAAVAAVQPPPDLVVHGCTAAGFLAGAAATAEIVAALGRQTGAAVVSTAAAMVEVLRGDGVHETAVITPYPQAVNDGLRAYLIGAGIEVETLVSRECRTTEELGNVTSEQVYDLALTAVTPHSKALFIACSQLPTLEILEPLRQRLGIPVWSSISATAVVASAAAARKSAH